jgi:adenylate cyclase
MGTEIERKFLVIGEPWTLLHKKVKIVPIKQGYISKSKKHTVRVRLTDKKAYITIKGPNKGLTRFEFEYEVPYEDGVELIKMCDGDIIDKTRYVITDEFDQVWDVDAFSRDGKVVIVVAEIELKHEDESIVKPLWVGDEVTFDMRYTNSYISTHGLPT